MFKCWNMEIWLWWWIAMKFHCKMNNYGIVFGVFGDEVLGAIGIGDASANGSVADRRRMNGCAADALLEQRRVLARQVVDDFVVPVALMGGVFVAQTEDGSPEIRSWFQVRQFGRHRRQHRPQRRLGRAPSVDFVLGVDVDVVAAHSRTYRQLRQASVQSKPFHSIHFTWIILALFAFFGQSFGQNSSFEEQICLNFTVRPTFINILVVWGQYFGHKVKICQFLS